MSDSDLSSSGPESGTPVKKKLLGPVLIGLALTVGVAGAGIGTVGFYKASEVETRAINAFKKLSKKSSDNEAKIAEVAAKEPEFDTKELVSNIQGGLTSELEKQKKIFYHYVDTKLSEQLDNFSPNQSMDETVVANLVKKITSKQASSTDARLKIVNNKLKQSMARTELVAADLRVVQNEFATAKRLLEAQQYTKNGSVKQPKRLKEFSLITVQNVDGENIALIEAPRKGKKLNTISLVKGEPFRSKLGSHSVKDIIITENGRTVITNDGYFIDEQREEFTPQELAALSKRKQPKPKKKKTPKPEVSIAKTKMQITEWEVLTFKEKEKQSLVINTNTGAMASIGVGSKLQNYGLVKNINRQTGQVDFDGYYIEGLRL